LHAKTKNSFRWEDQATSGYTTGVFDSDSSGNSEPVKSVGPGEYAIVVAGSKQDLRASNETEGRRERASAPRAQGAGCRRD
jgi:hypothetical protein